MAKTGRSAQPRPGQRRPQESLVVLGVDPGTLVTGYGVIARRGPTMTMLECGTIRNGSERSLPLRLKNIYEHICSIIDRFHPDEFAIESAFYGKNAQSALKLGHARGVSILAAVEQQIPTAEYSPREVKKAVVGNGAASKEQVRFMVKALLQHPTSGSRRQTNGSARMLLDASDALAIAICHLHRLITPASRHKNWKTFIASHPDRIKV